jgi:hypothetical protein
MTRPKATGITHHVKSWTQFFQAIKLGTKKHDLRDLKDRNYQVGDILCLQEYDQFAGKYTGQEFPVMITYITSNRTPCAFSSSALENGYAILSLEPVL